MVFHCSLTFFMSHYSSFIRGATTKSTPTCASSGVRSRIPRPRQIPLRAPHSCERISPLDETLTLETKGQRTRGAQMPELHNADRPQRFRASYYTLRCRTIYNTCPLTLRVLPSALLLYQGFSRTHTHHFSIYTLFDSRARWTPSQDGVC